MSFIDYLIHRTPDRQRAIREDVLAGRSVPWIDNSPKASYIRRIVMSAPPWVRREDLRALNDKRKALEKENGRAYHLDHIVPLSHPRVCGLTAPWNLWIIPAKPNMSKGNAWCPEQGDLFKGDWIHQ